MKVKATEKILSVYCGCVYPHDPTNCLDCKENKPCQYAVEGEYMKVGLVDIVAGEEFDYDEDDQHDELYQIISQTKDDVIYSFRIPLNIFKNFFVKIDI